MSKRFYSPLNTLVLLAFTLGIVHFASSISFSADTYTVPQTAAATLAWDPNEPFPDGYCIYQRTEGQSYDYSQPCWTGSGTSGTVYNIDWDTTYYFVVRAYDGALESKDSEEVSFLSPSPEPPSYPITATVTAHGAISPGGVVEVIRESDKTYTVIPDAGHHVADVKVDDVSVGAVLSYTFQKVTASHTIEATFAVDTYQITASAGANGSIAPSGTISVDHGATKNYIISPFVGYHITDLKVDSVSQGAISSYTFCDVSTNHTINASFSVGNSLNSDSDKDNGSELPFGTLSDDGSITIDDGQAGTSSTGKWSVSGGSDPYGSQSLYSKEVGATYSYEAAISGSYEVEVWWTDYASRCSSVPVKVYDGANLLDTVYVNQQENGGQWNFIGLYEFTGQARVAVVAQDSNCSTSADAVQYFPF